MDVNDRLARLGLRRGLAAIPRPRRKGPAIEELVPGQVVETEVGAFFQAQESLPLQHRQGALPLASLLSQSPRAAAELARDERLAGVDFRQMVFLDTETTGLAGGTGTTVFLVGIGYFADEAFHLRQFFMRGLEEEGAMLRALSASLDRFQAVVTFNGRGFDLPLLRTRFALARLPHRLDGLPHLDLLLPARRLWRARLDSCALKSLETQVLRMSRSQWDVPSWQIPELYVDYLRTGDGRPLEGVFYHNQQDVLSLAALAGHMCELFSDPWAVPSLSVADLYSLGRIYESSALWEEAERAYREVLADVSSREVRGRALHQLSFLLKRQGRREEAAELWREALARGRPYYAYVELAKHYEWEVRDCAHAAEVTRQALRRVEAAPSGPLRRRAQAELRHRLARLERKLERGTRSLESP